MKRIEKSYDKENYNRKYINGKDKCFSQNRFTQIVKIRKKSTISKSKDVLLPKNINLPEIDAKYQKNFTTRRVET
jgi:hypothetical protein